MRIAGWAFLAMLLGACANRDLTLLEQETLAFKVENEEIRAEDLQQRYERDKAKADQLSAEILVLGEDRARLYDQYDKLQADVTAAKRNAAAAQKQKAQLAAQLAALNKEVAKLRAELKKQQAAAAKLEADIEAAKARKRALEAKKSGENTPPQ